jgi:hypothetical protein
MRNLIAVVVLATLIAGDKGELKPIPPNKPLIFQTQVGEVAGMEGKIEVLIQGSITQDQIKLVVSLKSKELFGADFDFSRPRITRVCELLQTACEKIQERTSWNAKSGSLIVGAVYADGSWGVGIGTAEKKLLSKESFILDEDNANSLLKLLRRAGQITDWLEPRLPTFQSKGDAK